MVTGHERAIERVPHSMEGEVASVGMPIARARFAVKTTAKGEVHVEFTIEAQVPNTDGGSIAQLRQHLDTLQADAVERAPRIKREYERRLASGEEVTADEAGLL